MIFGNVGFHVYFVNYLQSPSVTVGAGIFYPVREKPGKHSVHQGTLNNVLEFYLDLGGEILCYLVTEC